MIYLLSQKFSTYQIKLNYTLISAFECNDSIINLTSPKLIDSLHFLTTKLNHDNLGDNFNDNQNNLRKSDKKYQPVSYSKDNVDVKKIKNKNIKKKRVSTTSSYTKSLFDHNQEEVFNHTSSNISELKIRKLSNKSKSKSKINDTNIVSRDIRLTNTVRNNLPNNIEKKVLISDSLTVNDLSNELAIPQAEIITYLFLKKSIAVTVNHLLDSNLAKEVAEHYHFNVISDKDEMKVQPRSRISKDLLDGFSRSPIVIILGHVDHGKTTLLDSILETNLVHNEFGGITQALSAYETNWIHESKRYQLIFLDTPGHQSFKAMRLRGASIADIVLLIISVEDGIKPQTVEAINYIKAFNLSCIVVITKVDISDKKIDFILNDLSNYGLLTQTWGGITPVIQVSAVNNRNINTLLSAICKLSCEKNLTANIHQRAVGTILDAYLDKKQGPVANILVQDGTLKVGDVIASANLFGRVKKIMDLSFKSISIAYPSSILQVLAFSSIPIAGLEFKVFSNEKEAKKSCLDYSNNVKLNKILNSRIGQTYSSNIKNINLVLKADTQGSLEAIIDLFSTISQSKVQLSIISASCTVVSNSDFELAVTTGASIVAFNINLNSNINNNIKKYNVNFKTFKVIYDLLEFVKTSMLDLLEPEYDRVLVGRAVVRTIFNMNKGCVAGCYVNEGKLLKSSYLCVYRKDHLVYEGLVNSLKRLKDDVNEVLMGNECGVMCFYDLWQENDSIVAYNLVSKPKLL